MPPLQMGDGLNCRRLVIPAVRLRYRIKHLLMLLPTDSLFECWDSHVGKPAGDPPIVFRTPGIAQVIPEHPSLGSSLLSSDLSSAFSSDFSSVSYDLPCRSPHRFVGENFRSWSLAPNCNGGREPDNKHH